MKDKLPTKLTKTQLREFGALFGAAPVLSSESEQHYNEMWEKLIECLMPNDFMELLLIRQLQNETWKILRYTKHQTIAIERRFRQSLEFQEQHKKETLARREVLAKELTQKTARPDTELSQLAHLEGVVESSLAEVKDLERIRAEFEHNRSLEAGIIFQEQTERLINSSHARRNDVLEQLELYRKGLGQHWRRISDEIIDAEVTEIKGLSEEIAAPLLVPANQVGGGNRGADDDIPAESPSPAVSSMTSMREGA
jgi:hypothetical protein